MNTEKLVRIFRRECERTREFPEHDRDVAIVLAIASVIEEDFSEQIERLSKRQKRQTTAKRQAQGAINAICALTGATATRLGPPPLLDGLVRRVPSQEDMRLSTAACLVLSRLGFSKASIARILGFPDHTYVIFRLNRANDPKVIAIADATMRVLNRDAAQPNRDARSSEAA